MKWPKKKEVYDLKMLFFFKYEGSKTEGGQERNNFLKSESRKLTPKMRWTEGEQHHYQMYKPSTVNHYQNAILMN